MALTKLFKRSAVDTDHRLDLSSAHLVLVLTDTAVQSAWWQLEQGQPRLKAISQIYDYSSDQNGIEKADTALQDLGPDAEDISRVMFGLESGWVDEGGITAGHKRFLRELTTRLSLQAAGYAVIQEALLHELAVQAGASLLLVVLTDHVTSVSLIEKGSLIRQERVGRSDDVASDLTEALARFRPARDSSQDGDQDSGQDGNRDSGLGRRLPAKVVLAAGLVNEEILVRSQDQLLDEKWQAGQPFIHQPVVEIVTSQKVTEAIVKHGGAAMISAGPTDQAVAHQTPAEETPAHQAPAEEVPSEQPPTADQPAQPQQAEADSQSSFGVPISQSQLTGLSQPPSTLRPPFPQQPTLSRPPAGDSISDGGGDGGDGGDGLGRLPAAGPDGRGGGLKRLLADDARHLGKWWYHHRWFGLAGFGLGLLVLLGVGVLFTIWGKTARVTAELEPLVLSQEVTIRLDPTADRSDPEELVLKAELTTVSVSTAGTALSTGAKVVGEPAAGQVNIFNKTDQERSFEAGTVLTKDDLEFTLDEEVQVASASVTTSDTSETRTFGQAAARVTASQVGADSNLPEGTQLRVASFSPASIEAQVSDGLTGGASREVRVVTAQDRDELQAELEQDLVELAAAEFEQQSGQGTYLVPTGQLTITDRDFDRQENDESDQLNLSLGADAEGLRYATSDLTPLAMAVLADQVPAGFRLDESATQILSRPADQQPAGGGLVALTASLSAPALPSVDAERLATEIAGLTVGEADSVIRQRPGVSAVTIRLTPFWAHQWSPRLPAAEGITVIIDVTRTATTESDSST